MSAEAAPTQPAPAPKMATTEVLDNVYQLLKDSLVLPLSSASLGSQFNRKVGMPFRDATGGVGILAFLRDYTDFEVARNRVTLTGEKDRDDRPARPVRPAREGQPEEGPRRRRRNNRKPRAPREGGETSPAAPKPKQEKAPKPQVQAAPKKERVARPPLKVYIVDFDDGCQNFAAGVEEIPESYSVHVYFAQRPAGSSATAPPEEFKRFHPHPTETESVGAVQTAITVRATQLAIQKKTKVEIYIVSGHVGKYAEVIPQVKRFGVTVVTEIDGTKNSLKDLVTTGV